MRTKEQVLKDQADKGFLLGTASQIALLTEVLLDIRDILATKRQTGDN